LIFSWSLDCQKQPTEERLAAIELAREFANAVSILVDGENGEATIKVVKGVPF
jgi:hypothetical protein